MPEDLPVHDDTGDESVGRGDHVGAGAPSQQPVGEGNYTVKAGDCLESIAYEKGFFWQTLWEHPSNAALKDLRKDPHVLLKGDRLQIPEIREKQEPASSKNKHSFVRKGVICKLCLRFLDADRNPRSDEPYTIEIDGKTASGVLDADGCLKVPISPNAKDGKIKVGDDEELEMFLGELDPIMELSGVQSRLRNLGYPCGPIDGIWGPQTRAAVTSFQRENGLEATGKLDGETRNAIKSLHDKD